MSKSYRAILPPLSDSEIERLHVWSAKFCAATAVFRENGGAVIWLATKERARSREAFMRSVRSTLRQLGIAAMPKKGGGSSSPMRARSAPKPPSTPLHRQLRAHQRPSTQGIAPASPPGWKSLTARR